ncbi:MAG TPA: sigma-70 family RNA polymerase sigma factor [Pyrinomonadaceae bacterium]|jgi:RNA polymerase sigma-70 factor (ECF subfamily)|nr:sigma-70 family RNA polymerase sigma factor [Pyrinomonadaceae bacterium]
MANTDEEFASIFNEFYPSLCRFLECILGGSSGAAQDIAQESFMQLYRTGLEQIGAGEARFWLFRVARNFALNELTKRSTRQRLFGRVAEAFRTASPTPLEDFETAERNELILDLLKRLPEHQRAALLLREHEEMSYSEMARVLNISESKVKVDVFRARTALREHWHRAQRALSKT